MVTGLVGEQMPVGEQRLMSQDIRAKFTNWYLYRNAFTHMRHKV
jgi:hypothetical protein